MWSYKMKTGRFTFALRSTFAGMLLFILWVQLSTVPLHGETAVIPGDIDQISAYTNFFYIMPSDDFFYYLNDRLLFMEKPDGRVMGSGLRNKLLRIVRWHSVIKKSLLRFKHDKNNTIAIDVNEPDGYNEVSIILNMLGLALEKTPADQYRVFENPAAGSTDYFRFAQINPETIAKQLNSSHYFYFKLRETEIPLPWDYGFLQGATGLKINPGTFLETLLKNEQFSVFLGMLYRLSTREADYIGGLVKESQYGAWKQIYDDKKFLLGMFILANVLRVNGVNAAGDDGTQWVLPGGSEAEETWNRLAGKDYKKFPMEFLYQLATKDEGKLNYLYLFAFFLPPETQKALFTGPNALEMEKLYAQVSLTEDEKLNASQFPGLRDFNFYTLLYCMHIKDYRFQFPQGVETWLKIIAGTAQLGNIKEETTDRKVTETPVVKEAYTAYAPKAGMRKAFYERKRSGVYIKFNGGATFAKGGDFDAMMEINKAFFKNLPNPSSTSGSTFFPYFGGEIGITWKKFSVGFEASSIGKKFKIKKPLNYQFDNEGSQVHELKVASLLLNVYFKILDTPFLNVSLSGGGGIYFGKYNNLLRYQKFEGSNVINVTIYDVVRKKSLGFHIGTVIDFFVTKKIALFLEGRYQFVNFNNMKGKGTYVYDHYLWQKDYFINYEGDLNFSSGGESYPADFYIGSNNYPGSGENLRKARFNLNGFALTLGGKFFLH